MKIYIKSNADEPTITFSVDEREYREPDYDEEDSEQTLLYESYNLSVMLDGKKIGYGYLYLFYDEDGDLSVAYVKDINIDESYRNHGYGTSVLRQLSDKYGGIYICPDNPDAERLYDRLGRQVSSPPEEIESELDSWDSIYLI